MRTLYGLASPGVCGRWLPVWLPPGRRADWSAVVPALVQAGHRVDLLDLLGFGASEKPKRHTYSIHEQV
jgi:hypothetical protein